MYYIYIYITYFLYLYIIVLFLDQLQRIERLLADIKFDINNLVEQYQVMSAKINSNGSNMSPSECLSPMSNDELSKLSVSSENYRRNGIFTMYSFIKRRKFKRTYGEL